MENTKIVNFTDLNTWKEAHKFVLQIYKITKDFPREENFILTNQILRAAISITSNIAEGFGRHGLKEKIQFYYLSQSSLTEVQNQLIISMGVGYIEEDVFNHLWTQSVVVHKLLTGLIKSLKNK